MSVIEPILRRLPPKVVIPALLAALMLLSGNAVATWRGGDAALKAEVRATANRVTALERGTELRAAAQDVQVAEMLRRLERLDSRAERTERAQLEALKFWYERVPGGEARARDMSRRLAQIK